MGRSKKRMMHTRKEEQQARRILIAIAILALILVLAMFVGYSFLG